MNKPITANMTQCSLLENIQENVKQEFVTFKTEMRDLHSQHINFCTNVCDRLSVLESFQKSTVKEIEGAKQIQQADITSRNAAIIVDKDGKWKIYVAIIGGIFIVLAALAAALVKLFI